MRYSLLASFISVFIFLIITFTPTVHARDKLIVVTEVWPPYRIEDDSQKYGYAGIDIDIIEDLEIKLQRKIEVKRLPFARALQEIKTGNADIITGVAHTPERSEFIEYIYPSYSSVQPVFITQKGKGDTVKSYEDLKKHDIGYSLQSAYFEPFDSDKNLKKIGVSTEEQLIKMVAFGRIDIIIGTSPNIEYDIKKFGFEQKVEKVRFIPPKTTPLYFGLSKAVNIEQLKPQMEEYFRNIKSSGYLVDILQKYK